MKKEIKPYNDKRKAYGLRILRFYNDIYYKGIYINNRQYGYWYNHLARKSKITFFIK